MSDDVRKSFIREPSEESRIHAEAERAEHRIQNAAQKSRRAEGHEQKKLTDSANVLGGETWENPSGHSGRPVGYAASGLIMLGFIIGGVGLTVGPHLLIWIGVAIIVIVGAVGMATHVWSDYRMETPAPDKDESGSMTDDAHT